MTSQVAPLKTPALQALATSQNLAFVAKIRELAEKKLCLGCFDLDPAFEERSNLLPVLPGLDPMHSFCAEFINVLFSHVKESIQEKSGDFDTQEMAMAYACAAVVKKTQSSLRKGNSDRAENPDDFIAIIDKEGLAAADVYIQGGEAGANEYLKNL